MTKIESRYQDKKKNKKKKKESPIQEETSVKPIVPGVRRYTEVVREGKKSVIFSTSMTKVIRIKEFNEAYTGGTAEFYRFHSGKSKHIKKYVEIHLDEQRPDSVILLAGGNDLWECTRRINPTPVREIAEHIIEAGKTCKRYNVEKIYILSVLPRGLFYLQIKRQELNTILRDLC